MISNYRASFFNSPYLNYLLPQEPSKCRQPWSNPKLTSTKIPERAQDCHRCPTTKKTTGTLRPGRNTTKIYSSSCPYINSGEQSIPQCPKMHHLMLPTKKMQSSPTWSLMNVFPQQSCIFCICTVLYSLSALWGASFPRRKYFHAAVHMRWKVVTTFNIN